MTDLVLHVKREYFEAIRNYSKAEEYRLCTLYWKKRLERHYDRLIICLGYPKKDDMTRRLVFEWHGATIRTITHKHFGDKPVAVYAIRLKPAS